MVANRIHPTAIIGAGVELGDNNIIGPYTVITGPTRIGSGNWIGPHVSIGGPAEYRGGPHPVGWEGEVAGAGVAIGDGNTLREFVAITQGTHETTTVGDDAYILARCQVGHDSILHNSVTMANAVQLGGHTRVWSWANLGLGAVVHQRTQIGPGAMVGMGSVVRRDVPAFALVMGNPARVARYNRVGLSRRGCSDDVVERFVAHLNGDAPLPDDLPPEVAYQLTTWLKVQAERN